MYRNSIAATSQYRPPEYGTESRKRVNTNGQTSHKSFEVLWRKRSAKMHKTWEGDAEGTLVEGTQGSELRIQKDTKLIASIRVNSTEIYEGRNLTSGSYEFEIGPALHTASTSGSTAVASNKRVSGWSAQVPGLKRKTSTPIGLAHSGSVVGQLGSGLPRPASHGVTVKINTPQPASQQSKKLSPQLGMTPRFRTPTNFQSGICSGARLSRTNANAGTNSGIDPVLAAKLRPHQIEAVDFMRKAVLGVGHTHGYGCILADEMGLGKTLSAIALIHTLLREKEIRCALVVCPVTLVSNWRNEFQKWIPVSQSISPRIGVMTIDHNGLGNGSLRDPIKSFFSDRQFRVNQVMVVGYERIRSLHTQVLELNKSFDLVVCDEGHRLKSAASKVSEAISAISEFRRVILTGTPVQNRLSEFWALSDFVNPGCLGSESKFESKYARPISQVYGANVGSFDDDDDAVNEENVNDAAAETPAPALDISSQMSIETSESEAETAAQAEARMVLEELTEICAEFMLRRTVSSIEKYLDVPKHELIVFCRPTRGQRAIYESLADSASNFVAHDTSALLDQGACLQAISKLRKVASGVPEERGGKMQALAALLRTIRDETDEKIVIVSGSTKVLDMCQSLCVSESVSWLRLDGSTPQEKRQTNVNIFNNLSREQAMAFLLSSRSGGVGLNLTGASRLVLMDCDWNPAIDAQVMARIHRDGQTRACYVYRLLTTGTIDEKIFQRQLSKMGISNNLLLGVGAGEKAAFSLETLRDLFTFTVPSKCNTLEVAESDHSPGINRYREVGTSELNFLDKVLASAVQSKNTDVSCVLLLNSPTSRTPRSH